MQPRAPVIESLSPGDPTYESVKAQLDAKWDSGRAPLPNPRGIYELVPSQEMFDRYVAKQKAFEKLGVPKFHQGGEHESGPGNENRRWHGTAMQCDFKGTLCHSPSCNVCRIIESSEFKLSKLGATTGNKGVYGKLIYFTSRPSTAKGYGLARGKSWSKPADLVARDAGNAIFLCKVLCGKTEKVQGPTSRSLPSGFHSRIVDRSTGVDELGIFDQEQAMPSYLVII